MGRQVLDAYTLPLHGSRLIEASAGTGKTWTIASLYLRLVLGHGFDGTAFARPLAPSEVLVVTFTRAATRELSERIRSRLLEAADCFRDRRTPDRDDRFLVALLSSYQESNHREHAAWRLAGAAEAMDESAVLTIDAWCQRMLSEHAFNTGNPFDETLLADPRALLDDAVRDYWRQHCYRLGGERLERLLSVWPTPQALRKQIGALVSEHLPLAERCDSIEQCIDRAWDAYQQRLIALASGWDERASEMMRWLDTQLAQHPSHWDAGKVSLHHCRGWLDKLSNWARAPGTVKVDHTSATAFKLTPGGLQALRRAGAPPIDIPHAFAALEQLRIDLARLPQPAGELRLHAASCISGRLATLKAQARSFSFSDIAERLERALCGPHGGALRARILAQYPVALIDEFQDTSPQQYRLFDALYGCAGDASDTALLLIGDPKQSIYRFRGADIHSYLRARRATAGRHYTLGINHRSTQAMVAAVNAWFERAETRSAPVVSATKVATRYGGAFLFRTATDDPVPFEPVNARGRGEDFVTSSGPVCALTISHDLHLKPQGASTRFFAAHCAERIVGWLNDPGAGFQDPAAGFRRLRPADIAVLVRTGAEAEAVRHELRRRRLASVYLSERDSVFASDEARDLLRWLRAVATPGDARLVRTALATRTIGLSLVELERLASDDAVFDARTDQMRSLHTVWGERGVLAMIRSTLHALALPARWRAQPDGERRLTNMLHLAELMQQASVELDGEQALIRWLAQRIDDEQDSGADDHLLRLESDADLIRVVTIHKSKGLEYPVVCLPFSCSFRQTSRGGTHYLMLADAAGTRRLKLDIDDQDIAHADFERLQEDIRLFYVALTRARHTLWMGFSAVRIGASTQCMTHLSAAGCLLAGPDPREAQDWLEPLQALALANPAIMLEGAPEEAALTRFEEPSAPAPIGPAPVYTAMFERRWFPGSYSMLVRDIGTVPIGTTAIRRPAEDEGPTETGSVQPPEPGRQAGAPWHQFPGGTASGDFIHGLLEWLDSHRFALARSQALQAMLHQRCERKGRGDWAAETLQWMLTLLDTPLPSVGVALTQLRNRLSEIEFWMPAMQLRAHDVDALCCQHLLDGAARPALADRQLNGMLMGYADLVFEHQGRYWVLDYKTNRLGHDASAYGHGSLQAEMARHRYDVQAAVYLLALHRLLRTRLGSAYSPNQHLGGALYWFVRGIDHPQMGEYAIPCSANLLALIDTLDRLVVNEDCA